MLISVRSKSCLSLLAILNHPSPTLFSFILSSHSSPLLHFQQTYLSPLLHIPCCVTVASVLHNTLPFLCWFLRCVASGVCYHPVFSVSLQDVTFHYPVLPPRTAECERAELPISGNPPAHVNKRNSFTIHTHKGLDG